jgi:trk system potassium uptake protein TrkH
MKTRHILYTLGGFLFGLSVTMLIPLICSLSYGEQDWKAFIISFFTTAATGIALYLCCKPGQEQISLGHKEGFIIVTAGWTLAACFGSLPYMIHGVLPTFVDAFFETMSGFTTTGASVIKKIEGLPHGILLWRSLTQWLGGMGIIILSIAVLPLLGVGGRQLFKAEFPGPVKDRLAPRIVEAARALWLIYVTISFVEFILLFLGGMNACDANCHTFTTMATGGFSTKDASVAHFKSVYIDTVITVFMLIAGINFTLHFYALRGEFRPWFQNSELRFFLSLYVVVTLIVAIDTYFHVFDTIGQSIRYASFQVASILTTTGYVTDNFARWPALSQVILILLMFVGGSAGSTGGSVKCIRLLLMIKHGYKELYRLIHPHAVVRVKLEGQVVPPDVMESIWAFFTLYLTATVIATLLMLSLGLDMITAFSSVATTLGNVGPGLGMVHPEGNFSDIPFMGKWILSFCMLIGRLELYTVLILLIPGFWKK